MMKFALPFVMATTAIVALSTSAFADPIQINDDEGYSRLARWESHLDQRISDAVHNHSLNPYRAWHVQKELDDVEQHVVQAYYTSNNGIDPAAFHQYAEQLRNIGSELGDRGWNAPDFDQQTYNGYNGDGGQAYGPPPPPPGNYYREGQYESDCQRGNNVAGTIFGALGGGLIGGAASHGNGAAIAGGVVVGGLLGNALTRDIPCGDQRDAFATYNEGLNGDVDHDYEWHHDSDHGQFRVTRDYYDRGVECRSFHTVTYRNGQRFERDGNACRQTDGNWHFE